MSEKREFKFQNSITVTTWKRPKKAISHLFLVWLFVSAIHWTPSIEKFDKNRAIESWKQNKTVTFKPQLFHPWKGPPLTSPEKRAVFQKTHIENEKGKKTALKAPSFYEWHNNNNTKKNYKQKKRVALRLTDIKKWTNFFVFSFQVIASDWSELAKERQSAQIEKGRIERHT